MDRPRTCRQTRSRVLPRDWQRECVARQGCRDRTTLAPRRRRSALARQLSDDTPPFRRRGRLGALVLARRSRRSPERIDCEGCLRQGSWGSESAGVLAFVFSARAKGIAREKCAVLHSDKSMRFAPLTASYARCAPSLACLAICQPGRCARTCTFASGSARAARQEIGLDGRQRSRQRHLELGIPTEINNVISTRTNLLGALEEEDMKLVSLLLHVCRNSGPLIDAMLRKHFHENR